MGEFKALAGKHTIMKRVIAALVLAAAAVPAAAQNTGYEPVQFVDAIKSGDNDKAVELLKAHPTFVNARDAHGDTALIIAIAKRDEEWTPYLLQGGADPNLASRKNGDTPLIAAVRAGYEQAVSWLLGLDAKVDGTNRMGETALIAAVQGRESAMVKRLLAAGANPDKTDSAAGYSARDYAKRDDRNRELIKLIEGAKPTTKTGAEALKL